MAKGRRKLKIKINAKLIDLKWPGHTEEMIISFRLKVVDLILII